MKRSAADFRQSLSLALTSLVLLPIVAVTRQHRSPLLATPQPRFQTVIFALSGETGQASMDAVMVVKGKTFVAPFSDEQKDQQQTFARNYFAAGKTYRLIFGGGEAGTVTVKKWSEGCNSIHAEVSVSGSARLGGQVRALATNSDAIGKRGSSRRTPTEGERAAVLKLVRSVYQQRRTPTNLLNSINVTNLTATDIDGDGKHEFVGSFTLATRSSSPTNRGSSPTVTGGVIKFERDLFLIAKGEAGSLRGDFVKFQAYKPPPEQFLSSIDFIDQLDVDGDGVGEVFAIQGGFDAYGYVIFKKVDGRWRQVYVGTGDAC